MAQRRVATQDEGAVAALFAVLVTVLLIMLAFVIDLGFLRADKRSEQTIADMAATAGAFRLAETSSPLEACQAAWGYFLANTSDAPPTTDPCGDGTSPGDGDPLNGIFPMNTGDCDPNQTRVAIKAAGPYWVRITWPIPDSHEFMAGRLDTEFDGDACERVAVEVERSRDFLVGPVFGQAEGNTSAPAVARAAFGVGPKIVAALVVLDPVGCGVLDARGQKGAFVHVWESVDEEGNTAPGIIAIDSDGWACGNPARVIRLAGGNATFKAGVIDAAGTVRKGFIFSFALQDGAPQDNVYDSTLVPSQIEGGRPSPERPVGDDRVTRVIWEHEYDCKSSYPFDLGDSTPHVPIGPCESGEPPHITNLRNQIAAHAPDPAGNGWVVLSGGDCSIGGAVTHNLPAGARGFWFDCDQLEVKSSGVLTIPDGDVVVRGGASVGNVGQNEDAIDLAGTLRVNVDDDGEDNVIFVRRGHFRKRGGAALTLGSGIEDGGGTLVLLDNGRINMSGNTGVDFSWFAPYSGNFENLALWTEWSSSQWGHDVGGDVSNLSAEGIFYMPNATFNFGGGGAMAQQRAQFVAYRLDLRGGGQLRMQPDPSRALGTHLPVVSLIR